jgi:hypothetical protein
MVRSKYRIPPPNDDWPQVERVRSRREPEWLDAANCEPVQKIPLNRRLPVLDKNARGLWLSE